VGPRRSPLVQILGQGKRQLAHDSSPCLLIGPCSHLAPEGGENDRSVGNAGPVVGRDKAA
jgi:hypothetical protein